jgi:hypothetical protein
VASHHVSSPLASHHVLPTRPSLIERTLRKGFPLKWGIGLGFRGLLLGDLKPHHIHKMNYIDDACTIWFSDPMADLGSRPLFHKTFLQKITIVNCWMDDIALGPFVAHPMHQNVWWETIVLGILQTFALSHKNCVHAWVSLI